METDKDLEECSCFQEPPEFSVPPPPKPFAFMTLDDPGGVLENLRQNEVETCPLYISDGTFKNILESKQTLVQINEPLFALIMITSCMIFILIFGGFTIFWCRRRNRCMKKNNFKSLPKATVSRTDDLRRSPILNGKIPVCSSNGNPSNTDTQIYGGGDEEESTKKFQPYFINYHSVDRPKQKTAFCDTHNPIYEEISLSNVPIGTSSSSKNRTRQLDYLNEGEIRNLLNNKEKDRDEFHSTNYCLNCKKPFILISSSSNQGNNSDLGYCKCYPITLPDNSEIYQTSRYRKIPGSLDYEQKSALL